MDEDHLRKLSPRKTQSPHARCAKRTHFRKFSTTYFSCLGNAIVHTEWERFYLVSDFFSFFRNLLLWHFKCTRHNMTCLCGVMFNFAAVVHIFHFNGCCFFRVSVSFGHDRLSARWVDRLRRSHHHTERDKMCITYVCKMPLSLPTHSTLIIEIVCRGCSASRNLVRNDIVWGSHRFTRLRSLALSLTTFHFMFWFAAIL